MERRDFQRRMTDARHARLLRAIIALLIGVLAVALLALALAGFGVAANAEELDANQQRIVEQAWRGCERQNQIKAELHSVATDYPPVLARRRGRVESRVPILNCNPTLKGRSPVVRGVMAQRNYVKRYQHGKLDLTPTLP